MRALLLMALCLLLVGACGIKPRHLIAPDGTPHDDDPFPRNYPSSATDPKPAGQ